MYLCVRFEPVVQLEWWFLLVGKNEGVVIEDNVDSGIRCALYSCG